MAVSKKSQKLYVGMITNFNSMLENFNKEVKEFKDLCSHIDNRN